MYQWNKTQLVFYQKSHDGAGQPSRGLALYVMPAIFQTGIKLEEKWLTNISFPPSAFISIKPFFLHFVSTVRCHMRLKLFSNLYLLISLKVISLPSDVASLLMRLKLSYSFGALCLSITPKASHYAHFVACLLYVLPCRVPVANCLRTPQK